MRITRRQFMGGATCAAVAALAGCGAKHEEPQADADTATGASSEQGLTPELKPSSNLTFDTSAWRYNSDDDVYYQLGVLYCEHPADQSLEQLAIFVPGAYLSARDNGDGTYACEPNPTGTVGPYTCAKAPIVMPVNTPGFSAQASLSEYESFVDYTGQGFIYVHAGCRGRDAGAPAGVVDLKAAIRYIHFMHDVLPGNLNCIFTFGMSGGGAQSAVVGATGGCELYDPYLEAIGAVHNEDDSTCGTMCWCPITGLDVADEAYEWMMGATREDLSSEEQTLSNGLAEAFAQWINTAGLEDKTGATLMLSESKEGIYQAGNYYECVRTTIEDSLNDFLTNTTFPYDASSVGSAASDGDGGVADGGNGGFGGGLVERLGALGDGYDAEYSDGISRTQDSGGLDLSGVYETPADYIAALNADGGWVSYDKKTGWATISSVADFCIHLKRASKGLGAFDQLDRGQGENTLFGQNGDPGHFDAIMSEVLARQGSTYAAEYAGDLAKQDALGVDVQTRVNMYTPLYYLLASQPGFGTSVPSRHWRIRSGICQGDTALTTELNLALALKANTGVRSVDFATVWGEGHTQAERTGTGTENFIAWVNDCLRT